MPDCRAQPKRQRERLSAVTRVRNLLVALALVAGLAVAPAARVAACDCAMTDLAEAIRGADVAFIGRLAGLTEVPAAGVGNGPAEISWTWDVERSRDPISADRITLSAWRDDGANCGVAFGVEERWLVVGETTEGRLQTNGCMRNQRLDGSDPDGETVIASLVTHSVGVQGAAPSDGLSVPTPLIVLLAGVAALAVVSIVAFRRGPR